MNGPGVHDISYFRGTSLIASVVYRDSNDAAVDLTGYVASMHVRKHDGTLLASTASGITATITAATGTIVFQISDAVGQAIPLGTHHYDVWVVSGSGEDDPLLTGQFTCVQEVRYA